ITRCLRQRPATNTNTFGSNKDAFGVEAVQQHAETFAFFPDAIGLVYNKILDEDGVGIHGIAAKLVDFTDLDTIPVEIRIEQGHSVSAFLALFYWRGSRQKQQFCRLLRCCGPDLSAVDDIFVAFPHRARADGGCIKSRVWLRYAKGNLIPSLDQWWNDPLLLFFCAVDDHRMRPEKIDVKGGASRNSAGGI